MAAAPVSTMVCFVKMDPSFQVVMNAINELDKKGRLQHVCTVTAGNNGLRSASDSQHFGSPNDETGYGFARTLGSVLRAFMLRSTYLEALHDPNFESKAFNLRANPAGYNRNVQPQDVPEAQLQIVQNVVQALAQAQQISANFDRLYPHFFIENKLAAVPQGTGVNLPGMMVIVELQEGVIVKFHTIKTTVTAKQDPHNKNIFECPDPNVVRITSAVLDLQVGQTDGDCPFFMALKVLLKAIVEVKIMSDEEIEALVKKHKKYEKTSSDKDKKEEGEEVAQQLEDLHLKT